MQPPSKSKDVPFLIFLLIVFSITDFKSLVITANKQISGSVKTDANGKS